MVSKVPEWGETECVSHAVMPGDRKGQKVQEEELTGREDLGAAEAQVNLGRAALLARSADKAQRT